MWQTEWNWDRLLAEYFRFPSSGTFHQYFVSIFVLKLLLSRQANETMEPSEMTKDLRNRDRCIEKNFPFGFQTIILQPIQQITVAETLQMDSPCVSSWNFEILIVNFCPVEILDSFLQSQKMWERRLKRYNNAFLLNPYLLAIHDHLDVQKQQLLRSVRLHLFGSVLLPKGDRTIVGPRRRWEKIKLILWKVGRRMWTGSCGLRQAQVGSSSEHGNRGNSLGVW